jgi:hypothetical protein
VAATAGDHGDCGRTALVDRHLYIDDRFDRQR